MRTTLARAKKQTNQILDLITSFPEFYLKKIDNFPIPVCMYTSNGTFRTVNQAYCDLSGYQRNELSAHRFDIVLPTEDREENMKGLIASYTQGVEFKDAVINIVDKSGRQFPVIFSSKMLKPYTGEDNLHIATVIEVSDKSQVEELMQKTHESLQRNIWRIETKPNSEELLNPNSLQEFSTPFENILKICEEIASPDSSITKQKEWLHVIQKICHQNIRQSKVWQGLIDMESKRFTPDFHQVDILQLSKNIFRPLHPDMENKDVSYKLIYNGQDYSTDQSACMVVADPLFLEQLISSLVLNAVEASPEEEEIRFSISEHEGHFEISLHNQGVVPEGIRENFFQKYATNRKPNKTGFGIYFARLIVEAHKGQINLETSEQEGTTITVSLPKIQQEASLDLDHTEFQI